MAIAKTIEVLNAMQADGVIGRYAIAGAVAAYNYIEPTVTEDLDILVEFNLPQERRTLGLVTLEPVLSFLAKRGYAQLEGEGIVIEGWRVQFLPIARDLDQEALATADEIELDKATVKTRILKPEYLVANCLLVGRPKDEVRIMQFLTEGAVDISALCNVVSRHGLRHAWHQFCAKMHIGDPCNTVEAR